VQFSRFVPMFFVAAGILPTSAAGQWTREPVCDSQNGNYMACALHAGHVPDLRDVSVASNEREVRFWAVSGWFFPDRVLVIHQRGDTVTGKLLLIWSGSSVRDTFARARCSDQSWVTAAGSLCVGRLAGAQDWAAVLRQLDAFGLSQLPGNPVPPACNRTPVRPTRPGELRTLITPAQLAELPPDRLCAAIADGVSSSIEVRMPGVYWRYVFEPLPDTTAVGRGRDQAILRLLTCAATKFGDRPC
jgi:hypothetical protein